MDRLGFNKLDAWLLRFILGWEAGSRLIELVP